MRHKWIVTAAICVCPIIGRSQITLEHTYTESGAFQGSYGDQLFLWEFDAAGTKYVEINRDDLTINLYNLDHTLFTNFSWAGAPWGPGTPVFLYLSDHLFDLDDGFEFMYISGPAPPNQYCRIYDQDGTILLDLDLCAPKVISTVHQQQYPIWSTTDGTKMIVSCDDATARVYSLPGEFHMGMVAENSVALGSQVTSALVYPDPTADLLNVRLAGPEANSVQRVQLVDQSGRCIPANSTRTAPDVITVDVASFPAGHYIVQLATSQGWLMIGRFVRE